MFGNFLIDVSLKVCLYDDDDDDDDDDDADDEHITAQVIWDNPS